ncbi:MAG: pyruvate kinase [Gammaproteobacteria bacterium]|nr:pyruvate kinase [Gammaproteobacteria bacterium]|tara:strand:+ start:7722 stop:9158 length:1437 start_codon:yes stop_codon:yes gene_type:complete
MRKRTKIITTLGPSTNSVNVIKGLIEAGTDVFRLNLSHARVDSIKEILNTLKNESKKLNRPVATLIDLQGQKIRIKGFGENKYIRLKSDDKFILDASLNANKGDVKKVGITYKNLYKNVIKGDELLLSDGLIKLQVTNIISKKIHTKVLRGGTLYSYQGLNKKGGGLSLKGLTAKDKIDLKRAITYDIDYIAVSFVKDQNDLIEIKKIIKNKKIGIIAKIERSEALQNLDDIVKHSDGILVARGDLGVEIGIEQLPAVQDKLINKAMSYDKLVIIATQMMESMKTNRLPTRAEVFDVSNAVSSGVDAIMLSGETAVGKYPVDVVLEASRICEIAESTNRKNITIARKEKNFSKVDQVIAMAAAYSADKASIKAIAALTETGSTALWMSRVQSSIPIYAMTQNEKTSRRICLYKGVYSIKINKIEHIHAKANKQVIDLMQQKGTVKKGDLVIITKGDLMGTKGGTNALKIVEVGNLLDI